MRTLLPLALLTVLAGCEEPKPAPKAVKKKPADQVARKIVETTEARGKRPAAPAVPPPPAVEAPPEKPAPEPPPPKPTLKDLDRAAFRMFDRFHRGGGAGALLEDKKAALAVAAGLIAACGPEDDVRKAQLILREEALASFGEAGAGYARRQPSALDLLRGRRFLPGEIGAEMTAATAWRQAISDAARREAMRDAMFGKR